MYLQEHTVRFSSSNSPSVTHPQPRPGNLLVLLILLQPRTKHTVLPMSPKGHVRHRAISRAYYVATCVPSTRARARREWEKISTSIPSLSEHPSQAPSPSIATSSFVPFVCLRACTEKLDMPREGTGMGISPFVLEAREGIPGSKRVHKRASASPLTRFGLRSPSRRSLDVIVRLFGNGRGVARSSRRNQVASGNG